ncbi:GntR family transcriptional regulator [Bacillus smithii]|uniref:GntR family transcriptional regulator n=1 Tax=Bacillus smithii TaxID=1479 RepID=UPI003D22413E
MKTAPKMTEEKIYHVLRDAIVNADFPPGQQLKENVLAEAFGVSRTPIRTVFQRLKYDSLIELKPKRGAFVYCPTPAEAEQIFSVRKMLEPQATELAAHYATPEEIDRMHHFLEEEKNLMNDQLFHQSLVATKNLHLSIIEASRNSYLIEFLKKIITLSHIILSFYDVSEHKEANAICEHDELLEAIKNHQPKAAKELAFKHIESIQNDIDFSKEFTDPVSITQVIHRYV